MASQIEQLRKQFDGYNNTQKKQFIDKLKLTLQTNKNPEYTKFLNECVQKYNTAVNSGGSASNTVTNRGSAVGVGATVEQKYENTIQLYLKNGYQIVSDANNTTIMFASEFFRKTAEYAEFEAEMDAGISNVGTNLYGNQSTNMSMNRNTIDTARTAALTSANTAKSKYEVAIRITKTGELNISGFTLEKLKEAEGEFAFEKKVGGVAYIVIAVIIIIVIVVLVSL